MHLENYEAPYGDNLQRHVKALAASDCLDGWFFALDVPPGASRAEVERAYGRFSSDSDLHEKLPAASMAAQAAFDVLMSSTWGRA